MRDGFRAELIASEPLVQDPVAIEFDEHGRMFVVQLPAYNAYVLEKMPMGSIVLLEDTDDDGRYDNSTLFADRLSYPTAVACWDGGLFVGDAPDLLYLKGYRWRRQGRQTNSGLHRLRQRRSGGSSSELDSLGNGQPFPFFDKSGRR